MRNKRPPSALPEARHEQYLRHQAKNIARAKRYRDAHPEVKRNSLRRVYKKLKDAAFKAYGNKYSCWAARQGSLWLFIIKVDGVVNNENQE